MRFSITIILLGMFITVLWAIEIAKVSYWYAIGYAIFSTIITFIAGNLGYIEKK